MKQVEVTIMGQNYVLGCPPGGESSLQAAVAQVDREMTAIRDAGRVRARERIAVLASLNLAYALAQRSVEDSSRTQAKAGADDDPAVDVDALIGRVDQALAQRGPLL